MKELTLPFPNVEFQALLTEIAAAKPDAVYAFFAGGGAVKFVKDYAAAGLNKTIPLVRPGLSHRRHARGAGRRGARHADHAALRRRPEHAAATTPSAPPMPSGLQGAARRLRGAGLRRGADARRRPQRGEGRHLEQAPTSRGRHATRPRSTARAASSRCRKAHNPVQDIYLRKVEGNKNKLRRASPSRRSPIRRAAASSEATRRRPAASAGAAFLLARRRP